MPCNNACLMGDICCKRYGGSRKPPCASQPEELSTTALDPGSLKLPTKEDVMRHTTLYVGNFGRVPENAEHKICSCCQVMNGERKLKTLGITDNCPRCNRKLS